MPKYYYNEKGQLSKQEDPNNTVKEYTYDALGNRQSFKLFRTGQAAPNIALFYSYDDLYRLKEVKNASGTVLTKYGYDEKGNRRTLSHPKSGIEIDYTYNDANRITSLKHTRNGSVIALWKYIYDVDGNLLTKTNTTSSPAVTISYRYDRLGRLIEEDYPGWKKTKYTYDAYSNRTEMEVEGKTKDDSVSVTNYKYGLNNWLKKEVKKQGKVSETYNYRYDNNGNEIFRIWERTTPTPDYPGTVQFARNRKYEFPTVYEWRHYNGFNQLIKINQDNKEIMYQYRGDGMRHSSEVRDLTETQSKTTVYYWDGTNIVAEQTDGKSVKCYLRGINLIAREMGGMVYYYIHNEHGDVAQIRGENGTCKASYEFDAFGNEKNLNKDDENPFRYCGEYYDVETKTVYLRNRDYDASIGRFTQEDTYWNPENMIYGDNPVRLNEREADENDLLGLNTYTYKPEVTAMMQSTNLYVYGINSPICYQDLSGDFAISLERV